MECASELVLIAHGSKDSKWSKSFESLVDGCSDINLHLAYMDFMEPSLFSVVNELQKKGIKNIKILPLFMSGGGHVDKDIPEQVKELKAKYADINFEVLSPIGEHSKVITSMREVIRDYAKQN